MRDENAKAGATSEWFDFGTNDFDYFKIPPLKFKIAKTFTSTSGKPWKGFSTTYIRQNVPIENDPAQEVTDVVFD